MQSPVERHSVRGFFRVAYVFVAPAVLLYGLYLSAFLALNSRSGSEWVSAGVSNVVAGRLEFAFAAVGPDLITADVYDARLQDLNGRTVVELRRAQCRFSPGGFVRRRIVLSRCEAYDGRVLVESLANGHVGLMDAMAGEFRPKQNVRPPPIFTLNQFEAYNVDVLISTPDLVIRFDEVELTNGRIEGGRGVFEFDADAVATGGRFLASERLFGFGAGAPAWSFIEWDIQRANRPWSLAWVRAPRAPRGERGMLDIPFDDVVIDRFRLRGEDMEVGRLLLAGPEATFDGNGLLRLMPEQPKLGPRERAIVAYEGEGTVTIPPDSRVLTWALPGVFPRDRPPSQGRIDPLEFHGYGTVRFFQGATRLTAADVDIAGLRFDRIDTGVTWDHGHMSLSDDTELVLYGGRVTGRGSFLSDDGTWEATACVEGLDVGAMAADVLPADSALIEHLELTLSTSPAVCDRDDPSAQPGVTLSGDLTTKAFSLAPAIDTPEESPIQAPMIEGFADDVALRWRRSPAFMPRDSARVSLSASLSQRGVLTVTDIARAGLEFDTGSESLAFSGTLDLVGRRVDDGEVRVRSESLGDWLPRLGLDMTPRGLTLTASGRVDGPFDAPDIDALEASFRKPEDGPWLPAFSLDLSLDVDGDRLVVDNAALTSSAGDARARGSLTLFDGAPWQVRRDPALDVTVVLGDVNLGAIAPDIGVDATFDATFGLQGTASAPVLSGSHLEVVDFRAFGEPIDYLWVDSYRFSDDVIEAESIFLVKGKGNLRGDVLVDLESRALEADLAGRRFRLGEIRRIAEAGVSLGGDTDFDLHLGGTLDAPTIGGRVTVEDLRPLGIDMGDVAATFYTFEGAVEVAAEVATDLDVAARIPIDGAPWDVDVAFHRLPIDQHVPSLEGVFERGFVSGSVEAVLDPFGEEVYQAIAELTALDLRVEKRRFEMPRPAVLTWRAEAVDGGLEQRLAIQDAALGIDGHFLDAAGHLAAGPDGTDVLLRLVGESDFSLLRFFPDLVVDAGGLARVDLTVEGTVEDASLSGEVAFDEARIAPRGLGTSVRLGAGRFVVADSAIRVEEAEPLTGRLFGGDFTAWGEIGLDGLNPSSVDYRLFVTNLAYRIPNVANVTLTSENLRFEAPDLRDYDTWRISGDVELVDARYYDDIEVVGDSFSFGGFGRTVESFSLPVWQRVPAIGRMNADLRIQGRDRFRVDNTIASAEMDLEFRTDLYLTGRIGEMVLVGELEALEGSTVTYRGRTFEVQQATLSFRGARDPRGYPMPVLDSELTASIRPCSRRTETSSFDLTDTSRSLDEQQDVFLTAFVQGQLPYDLSFQLQSTPFYDQRDQLSLILTGCTVDELTVGDAGGRTLEVVLAPVIDVVERSVEERLDLDDVDLIPATDGSTGISIQDEVSERFTWRLDASLGSETTEDQQVIRGEYRLFDWLLLEIQEQSVRDEDISVDTGFRFRVRLD